MEKPAADPLGNRLETGGDQEASGPNPGRDRTKIAELFADEQCSGQAILGFLATTDVGRTAGPPVAEEGEGGASEASEWEDRTWTEREEQLALSKRRRDLEERSRWIAVFVSLFTL